MTRARAASHALGVAVTLCAVLPSAATQAADGRAAPLAVARDPNTGDPKPADPTLGSATSTQSDHYVPVSPFQDDLPCVFIPWPRCGAYPYLAFGVQGGAASTPVGWERIVRPYADLGLMTERNDWLDLGASILLAYDSLEATDGWSVESKLRVRMWIPYGFFGDVYAGPIFERFAYPGTETGTRMGGVIGALFSFSDLIGLEAQTTSMGDLGGAGGDEFRYTLGVRFSLTTVGIVIAGIARAYGR